MNKALLIPLLISLGTSGAQAEDDRFTTDYDDATNGVNRVKIWEKQSINEGAPSSYGSQTQAQGSVGISVDGQSLESTWDRFNNSTEVQTVRSQTTTIASDLSDLATLVATLEEGGAWALIEPIVSDWSVVTDTSDWDPDLAAVTDQYQFRDGELSRERLVEVYEEHRDTGEQRLVESYAQQETQYFYNARLINTSQTPNPADGTEGWSEWKDYGQPIDCQEWTPKPESWPSNALIPQGRTCRQPQKRAKYIWLVDEDTNDESLIDIFTNTSDGGMTDKNGNPVDYEKSADSGPFCFFNCNSNSYAIGDRFREYRVTQRATGPNFRNGCFYDESDVPIHHRTDEGGVNGGEKYLVETFFSNNVSAGTNMVLGVHVEGFNIVDWTYSCFAGFCSQSNTFGADWIDTPYDPAVSPFRSARNNGNSLLVSEMPILVPAIGKKITIGRKMSEDSYQRDYWYDDGQWTEAYRKHKVCISNI